MKLSGISDKGFQRLVRIAQDLDSDNADSEELEVSEDASSVILAMTRQELKHKAQDMLMHSLSAAYYSVWDDNNLTDDVKELLVGALKEQQARIERLFGYESGSWSY